MTDKIEIDSQVNETAGVVAQSEAKEQPAQEKIKLPETVEDFEKALQSASSKKMNEFLKKYGAEKLSDIEERLSKTTELEQKIKDGEATKAELQKYQNEVAKLQKIIDEQTPIIKQKQQSDFLKENNVNPDFADDFFAIYEKKLNSDQTNKDEVIKEILTKHPQMGAFKLNEIKTSVKTSEKQSMGDGNNGLRKAFGLKEK